MTAPGAPSPELQPILEELLRASAEEAGAPLALLFVTEAGSDRLRVQASRGFDRAALRPIDRAPGTLGPAFQQRRRVIVEDLQRDAPGPAARAPGAAAGIRAVHSTPLVTRSGNLIGALSFCWSAPHHPSPAAVQAAERSARQAADFLDNDRRHSELRETDRTKNQFLASLVHELRNPLAPVRNAVRILHMKAEPSPEVQWALEVVDRQMNQLSRVLDDLLDVTRLTDNTLELRREPVEVSEVLRAAVQTSRPLMDASGQELSLRLPAEPVFLDGDQARLAQVISNLLNNASKFTPRGGRIALTAEARGGEAVISVTDTGIGIAPELLPHVFEIFAQTPRSPEQPPRLGLGLTLGKRLVEMHGGTIEARSAGRDQGSEFVIRLPRVKEVPDALRPAAAPAGTVVPLRILIVDDNEDAAASLGLLLRLTGHEIRTAHDGEEAMRLAGEFRPEVAVLDLGLPKVDGYEVASLIRRESWGADMVLIAATGWGQETDRHRSREAGFDHHLVKPVDPAALMQLLASFDQESTPGRPSGAGLSA